MNLEDFCGRFHSMLEGKPEMPALIESGRSLLGDLLSNPDWFRGTLERVLLDRTFLEQQRASIWPNEISLYRNPDGAFVVLAYLWDAGAVDAVHDHGSWGIIGGLINPSLERKFRRLDDGKREGYAELEETSSRVIEPGGTTYVLPLNEGIHQMENLTDEIAVSVNVYGRVIRKGYVQFFYPQLGTVARVYPPKTMKKVLAARVLGTLGQSWAKDLLAAVLQEPLADSLKKEYEEALTRINSTNKDGGK